MSERRRSPRTVFFPAPVRDDVAAALQAAGHRIVYGSAEAFGDCDTVLAVAPWSTSALFYAGAACAQRKLLVALHEPSAPQVSTVERFASATAESIPELIDLLGRWDPVALAFDPSMAATNDPTKGPLDDAHR